MPTQHTVQRTCKFITIKPVTTQEESVSIFFSVEVIRGNGKVLEGRRRAGYDNR
ncbi:hypothetical protein HOLleu_02667 [Holothuria leucospilota]|uniref:Uncharacterized protein n=1 Tax=Holothuria leucospilota TaxID=206669 RepID=A0A9Q1HL05_HOLLE|nr:hypothetical protein HOLleu_02667 [Holothuria leucospilota]